MRGVCRLVERIGKVMTFLPHDPVIWTRISSGGYGFGESIPAVVVKVGPTLVTIEVPMKTGEIKRVSVRPVHLKLRHVPEHSR
jgi:hypothetical protein